MDLHLTDGNGGVIGSVLGALAAAAVAVRWWYHTRRLQHADDVDGSVSQSISFVLNELRTEIARQNKTIARLQLEIEELKAENAELKQAKEPYGL